MTNYDKEQALEKTIFEWLSKTYGERYAGFASNAFLSKLLTLLLIKFWNKIRPHLEDNEDDLRSSREQAAYDVGCTVFEHLLENGCGVTSNGHHVARAFAQAMKGAEIPE